ncbi:MULTISPECIES: protein kinase domain-containing protein [Streptomycetaceae]|uniref:Serine/threonine protein kinase n=1 Tax=Streptantibioticus cattleyicolor (strain ATCC 35852 / DSM 46488 / JCM 4925 / NBRC 14057 / NRRL 8057) TaxID=1003195 RepID=F8K2Y3_STREN|nr:protein kinase [Streptantibioticus cattleyicolor]AEW92471.1 serine/threonine protein kinase [Streptantibioticus cattleyicolor NRRL 8057 = DSM 46488]MYS57275.1 protein kinase [Streptomyces sp. SID5468]CCB72832.1 putative Mitogen-activated protein kinase kinase [Streptantibioticus cattleyicolor NRRL 8057 = DSM 46488]
MGRPRRELDPQAGPLEAFCHDLEELRAAAGLTLRRLEERSGYSKAALSKATSAVSLPSLDLTMAYVGACGGDQREWESRWTALREVLNASRPELLTDPSGPAGTDAADALRVVRETAGAGRHGEAAAMAAAWEEHARRSHGDGSAQVAHWAGIRADLARMAGDMAGATGLWIAAARARLAGGPADDPALLAAARSAHWCWQQIADPDRARQAGVQLLDLLRSLPALDPRHVAAAEYRLAALGPGATASPRPDPAGTRWPGSADPVSAPPGTAPSGGRVPRRAVAPLLSGDPDRVGPFRLLGRLGSGAMGQVFLGVSRAGRPVAVKVVRSELAEDATFRRRFAAEVAAARTVQGPYTPAVVDADPDAERPWMATTCIPGPSLGDVVSSGGPLPAPVVRALAAGIAEALTAIHAAGVLHRDLKPGNVLLDRDGPKVIDFGIAHAADHTRLTRTGAQLGTVPYMAPEQAAGRPVGPATDVFALGSLLAYAATGIPPFGESGTGEVLYRIVHSEPDPEALECADPALRELIGACLAKDPARRPTPGRIVAACAQAAGAEPWPPPALAARLAEHDAELTTLLARQPERRRMRPTRPALRFSLVPLVLATGIVVAVMLVGSRGGTTGHDTGTPPATSRSAAPVPKPARDGQDPYTGAHCGPDQQEADRRAMTWPDGSPYGYLVLFHSPGCAASWGYVYGPNSHKWSVHITAHRQGDGATAPSAFSGDLRPNSWGNVLSTRTGCVWIEGWVSEEKAQSRHTVTDCVQDGGPVTVTGSP